METFIAFFLSYFIEAIIFWAYSDTFFPAKFSPQIRAAFLSASYAILLGFSFLKLTGFFYISSIGQNGIRHVSMLLSSLP